ncbi:DUF6452 family protein [Myroides phaeus]|uniref:Uncharacterized protein n=1 Tax=Myroides phaeus TaxID=702745 RepID=A0A1G8D2Z6_9FLAO|nr:DUF6452 family protein [Myroides phaeus]MEC4116179.1 DUF6452 family protein [Myroides phaeus]SDH51540.1 hypothetical protein SAMN05421818_105116 [Myroides phaeus]
MKKLILAGVLLCIGSIAFVACEKDDICAETEPTTPSFRVEFYNYEDQDIPRNERVEAFVAGREKEVIVNSGNKLTLPLRLDQPETAWILKSTQKVNNENVVLYDTLTFKYKITTKYLNKACGYVSTFSLSQDGTSPQLNGDATSTTGNWIKQYITETNEIVNEDEAHFKIFY